ncbi:MAG: DNA recombination protein RmuC [Gemmatimonadetes bacterium]|nr:DNA recombination protein RmuC [Gemmatimonadota bacterium]
MTTSVAIVLTALLAAALGLVVGWLFASRRSAALEAQLKSERDAATARERVLRESGAEKERLVDVAESRLREAFSSVSAEVLQQNSQSFLQLAEARLREARTAGEAELEARQRAIGELVRPIGESLKKVDEKLAAVEQARLQAQTELTTQLRRLSEDGARIQQETSRLVTALRRPQGRGRWGELQLRRVVEMAGMVAYCDFEEQLHVQMDGGGTLRPDMVVRLPGDKRIVVDAKVAAEAYLEAIEAEDEARRRDALRRHADQVRQHLRVLGDKAYWNQFADAPDFVVLFMPGDPFLSAALEADPSLFDDAISRKILLCGPTTLVALLKAAAYGWQQATLSERAEEIRALGQELYARLVTLADHFAKVGRGLQSAVDAYDKAVGSLEARVLVTGRKLQELGAATTDEIAELEPLGRVPRALQAPEMTGGGDEG